MKKSFYKVAKQRENNLRKAFIKIMFKTPLKNVVFSKNRISLTFFGHRISEKIKIQEEDHVADWSRRRKEIFVDKRIGMGDVKKSYKALCVHEVIEKFMARKYGLRLDEEAHLVAKAKEKEYLDYLGGNWRSHEHIVYWDWHNHGEH